MTVCEACSRAEALYACRECGRKICGRCLNAEVWLCPECSAKVRIVQVQRPIPSNLLLLGFILILAGMVLMALSTIMSTPLGGGRGFFLFFPFPFIFGFGFGAGEFPVMVVVFLAIALIFLAIVAYVFFRALRLQP